MSENDGLDVWRRTLDSEAALRIPCPVCGAAKGARCVRGAARIVSDLPHSIRLLDEARGRERRKRGGK